jgi:SAM-dependent methyltransferase
MMTGDSFFDELSKRVDLSTLRDKKILEVGPGYGRLLSTLLARAIPYASYTALELSQDRVRQLTEKFGDNRTRFVAGDAMEDVVDKDCDLFVSSATFEHLYPNFTQAILNIGRQLKTGADLCVDFVQIDPDMLVSSAWFESQEAGGAFVRVYSRAEIDHLLNQCGVQVDSITSITAGVGFQGEAIRRILVHGRLVQSSDRVGGVAQQTISTPLAIGTAESAEWPIHSRVGNESAVARLRSRAWRGLYALRHARAVKPYVDRIAVTRGYRLLKKIAAENLLRNR